MAYVDGFVTPVPRDRIEDYKALSRLSAEILMELGALSYVDCLADDVPAGEVTSFPRAVQLKDDEVVAFSWVTYPSRAARDEIMGKVMQDKRLMDQPMPFDGKRMIFGGFAPFLER